MKPPLNAHDAQTTSKILSNSSFLGLALTIMPYIDRYVSITQKDGLLNQELAHFYEIIV
jgi:hypothetical protein